MEFHSKKLRVEIKKLEEQKRMLDLRVSSLKREKSLSLTYLDWYKSLRIELFDKYDINIDEEINSFVNMLYDFKYYGYDAHEIVKEYKKLESLRAENKSIEGTVELNKKTCNELENEIERLKQNKEHSKQSINIVLELYHAGFGFKELRQLRDTVVEISEANNISWYKAGNKFIQDIENQYDYKLGFEPKIKELEAKLKKLENEEPQYNEYKISKDIVNRALPYLYNCGVTDEDIISMTEVVNAYLNGYITFNPNLKSENRIYENRLIKAPHYWRSLINEIKNLGDINSQIENQSSGLKIIKKEIDELNFQRQKLNEQTLLSSQLLNSIHTQFPYFMESIKNIMLSIKETEKMLIIYQPLFFINVTVRGEGDKKDNDNNTSINDKSL